MAIYKSILKKLDRTYAPLWQIVREQKITQSRWIRHLRWGLNMSARQLGKRMGISSQTVLDMERRELEETITLATLRKAARALDLDLFYMFVPMKELPVEKSLQDIIKRQAHTVAARISSSVDTTMNLENQGTSDEAIEELIEELQTKLAIELPSSLWD